MPQPSSGLFITLEGGEGSGKSTLMARLKEEFERHGRKVVTTFEPGATALGKEIRRVLLVKEQHYTLAPKAELFLFLANRAQHLKELILPALSEGKVVICDRFNDSTIAYQGFARGIDIASVEMLCNAATDSLEPNCTLLLDLDPEVGLERSRRTDKEEAASGSLDRMESEVLAFHQKLRAGFLWLASQHPERIHRIDASVPADEVAHQALLTLSPWF